MKRLIPFLTALFAISLCAADFWKVKDPSQWTNEEVTKMLTKSPWVRSVSLQPAIAGLGGGDGGDRGGGGDVGSGGEMGGGGGRGGRGGMGAPMPMGANTPPITVRWESAAPVRAANDRQHFAHLAEIAEWSKENYVVSLTGFQARAGMRGGAPGEDRSEGQRGEARGDPRGGAARSNSNPNSDLPNFRGAVIRHDNKQSFQVDRTMIIRTEKGPGLYLLFSRKNAIAETTKEIIIDFAIGNTKIQAKFKVKDLEYRGKLDL